MDQNEQTSGGDQGVGKDDEQAIWRAVADAGMTIRPDFSAPDMWVSATRWGQYGPFHTRSEALGAAIRALVNRNEQQDHTEKRRSGWKLFDGLSDLFLF